VRRFLAAGLRPRADESHRSHAQSSVPSSKIVSSFSHARRVLDEMLQREREIKQLELMNVAIGLVISELCGVDILGEDTS